MAAVFQDVQLRILNSAVQLVRLTCSGDFFTACDVTVQARKSQDSHAGARIRA